MKYLGIINQHHSTESSHFNNDKKLISEEDAKKVLDYINSYGEKFAVSMQVVNSYVTGEVLGSIVFYTDGNWIWPSYFSHYLKHQLVEVPNDFINYLEHVEEKYSYTSRSISEVIKYHKRNFDNYLRRAKSN